MFKLQLIITLLIFITAVLPELFDIRVNGKINRWGKIYFLLMVILCCVSVYFNYEEEQIQNEERIKFAQVQDSLRNSVKNISEETSGLIDINNFPILPLTLEMSSNIYVNPETYKKIFKETPVYVLNLKQHKELYNKNSTLKKIPFIGPNQIIVVIDLYDQSDSSKIKAPVGQFQYVGYSSDAILLLSNNDVRHDRDSSFRVIFQFSNFKLNRFNMKIQSAKRLVGMKGYLKIKYNNFNSANSGFHSIRVLGTYLKFGKNVPYIIPVIPLNPKSFDRYWTGHSIEFGFLLAKPQENPYDSGPNTNPF
jgi:hypothetical protein